MKNIERVRKVNTVALNTVLFSFIGIIIVGILVIAGLFGTGLFGNLTPFDGLDEMEMWAILVFGLLGGAVVLIILIVAAPALIFGILQIVSFIVMQRSNKPKTRFAFSIVNTVCIYFTTLILVVGTALVLNIDVVSSDLNETLKIGLIVATILLGLLIAIWNTFVGVLHFIAQKSTTGV